MRTVPGTVPKSRPRPSTYETTRIMALTMKRCHSMTMTTMTIRHLHQAGQEDQDKKRPHKLPSELLQRRHTGGFGKCSMGAAFAPYQHLPLPHEAGPLPSL